MNGRRGSSGNSRAARDAATIPASEATPIRQEESGLAGVRVGAPSYPTNLSNAGGVASIATKWDIAEYQNGPELDERFILVHRESGRRVIVASK